MGQRIKRKMKTTGAITATACGLMLLTAGCSKQESPAPTPAKEAKSATDQFAADAKKVAGETTEKVKDTAQKVTTETKEAVAKVTEQLNSATNAASTQTSTSSQGL